MTSGVLSGRDLLPVRQEQLVKTLQAAASNMLPHQLKREGSGPPPLISFKRAIPLAPHLLPLSITSGKKPAASSTGKDHLLLHQTRNPSHHSSWLIPNSKSRPNSRKALHISPKKTVPSSRCSQCTLQTVDFGKVRGVENSLYKLPFVPTCLML